MWYRVLADHKGDRLQMHWKTWRQASFCYLSYWSKRYRRQSKCRQRFSYDWELSWHLWNHPWHLIWQENQGQIGCRQGAVGRGCVDTLGEHWASVCQYEQPVTSLHECLVVDRYITIDWVLTKQGETRWRYHSEWDNLQNFLVVLKRRFETRIALRQWKRASRCLRDSYWEIRAVACSSV